MRATVANTSHGSSSGTTMFRTTTQEEHPSEIYVVFEVPEYAVITSIRVPQEIGVPTTAVRNSP